MARRISPLLPSALLLASIACGSTNPGLFSGTGPSGDSGGSADIVNRAGAPSTAGDASTPVDQGGDSSVGATTGSGGNHSGGSNSGGSAAGMASAGSTAGAGGSSAGSGGSSAGSGGTAAGAGGNSAGSGGTADAAAGSAGSGGSEPTCQELLAQAATQLTAARACNLAHNAMQCTGKVKTTCNCEVPVEDPDSPETQAYEATLKQINENRCVQVCPAIACAALNHVQCQASALFSTAGSCVSGYGPTPF